MKTILILIASFVLFSGCATIIGGYETTIKLSNVTDSTFVKDASGKDITISNRQNIRIRIPNDVQFGNQTVLTKVSPEYIKMLKHKYDSLELVYDGEIKARRSEDLHLQIHHQGKQIKIYQYPKVGLGWFFLDLLTGGVGFVLDGYTGNWNAFEDIDLDKSL